MCLHNGSQANQGPARTTKRKWTRNVIFLQLAHNGRKMKRTTVDYDLRDTEK